MNRTRLWWWAAALLGATTIGVLAIIVATATGGQQPVGPTPSTSASPTSEPTEEPTVPTVAVDVTGTLRALPDSGTNRVYHLQVGDDTLLPVTVPPELDVITDSTVRVTILVPDTLDLSGTDTERIRSILTYIDSERGRTVEAIAISE